MSVRGWRELKASLGALLYERDPEGMGATVSAPPDEYADVAVRIISSLSRCTQEAELRKAVLDILPTAWPDLVDEILSIYHKMVRAL